jgi:DNA invertase Pin-like site-specific DNA recombinase
MRVAIYLRSTQHSAPEAIAQQIQFMRDLIFKNGDDFFRIYHDKGPVFGENRPAYRALLADAQHGRFEKLLFWELKQLSQQNSSKTLALLDRLSTWGIVYTSCSEPQIDSSHLLRGIILPIIGILARQDSIYISECTRTGLQRQQRQRTPGPKGNTALGRPIVEFDEERAKNLRYGKQPKTLQEIAQIVGVSKSTIHRFFATGRKSKKQS